VLRLPSIVRPGVLFKLLQENTDFRFHLTLTLAR
jgi:hypothetical protein